MKTALKFIDDLLSTDADSVRLTHYDLQMIVLQLRQGIAKVAMLERDRDNTNDFLREVARQLKAKASQCANI